MTSEETKTQLEEDVKKLTKLGLVETQKLHQLRTEFASLETQKEEFLKQRQTEELLLLEEIKREQKSAHLQLNAFRDIKKRGEEQLQKFKQSLKEEQRNLEDFEKLLVAQDREFSKRQHELELDEKRIKVKRQLTLRAYNETEKTKKLHESKLLDLNNRFTKIEEVEEKLSQDREKVNARIEELSSREKILKIRESELLRREKVAQQKLDEARKLVMWHEESKKL